MQTQNDGSGREPGSAQDAMDPIAKSIMTWLARLDNFHRHVRYEVCHIVHIVVKRR
jgi:hypothetical protein